MRHGKKVKKLGRKKAHRLALLRNLCRALFIFEKIKTTLPKAKEARRLAEHLIEYAKKNTVAGRRFIYRFIPDHKLVKIICDEIAPKFVNRQGGYTRIYRLGPRLGDGAEMAILELVEKSEPEKIEQRRRLIERRRLPEGEKKPERPKKEKPKKELKKEVVKKEPKLKLERKTRKEKKEIARKEKKEKKKKKVKKKK
jgi:large subunit ribosomal protein L17|uniref:Large ribosomal subunit protein bL17 n=1 Tax=candidate division WOR-3 bacterium TaxID=2052148 RepID=A0A7V3RIJ6_UNCW3